MNLTHSNWTKRWAIALLLGIVAVAVVVLLLGRAFAEEQVRVAKPAPQFVLKDVDGHDVKLSDYKDRALIVMFLMSWDKHCMKQLPDLLELYRVYGDKEFAVVGMSLDQTSPRNVKDFMKDQEIIFPVAIADYKTVQDFGGLNAIPTMFVIDKNHNVIQKYVGVIERHILEADIKAMLNQ